VVLVGAWRLTTLFSAGAAICDRTTKTGEYLKNIANQF